jgi:hypothetical protein
MPSLFNTVISRIESGASLALRAALIRAQFLDFNALLQSSFPAPPAAARLLP